MRVILWGGEGGECRPTLVLVPLLDIGEVQYPRIVVILPRKDDGIQVARVGIGNRVA